MQALPEALFLAQAGRFGSVVATSESDKQYSCFQFDGIYFDEQPHMVDKGDAVTLTSHIDSLALKVGEGIEKDCQILLWTWIGDLVHPQNHWLVAEIAAVCQLRVKRNVPELIKRIQIIQLKMGRRVVARDPLFGEICGLEYGAGELATFQIPQEQQFRETLGVRDIHIRVELGPRLQSECWRLCMFLKRLDGSRVSCPANVEIWPNDRPNTSLKFVHVPKEDLRLVVELFSDSTHLATGEHPVEYNGRCECTMMSGGETCPLISAIHITASGNGIGLMVPSLLADGLTSYEGSHLLLSGYAGPPEHTLLVEGTKFELCSDTEYAALLSSSLIRLELYKGFTMVSTLTINAHKPPKMLVFPAMTTFSSLKFTKTIATARCELQWLGKPPECAAVTTIMNCAFEKPEVIIEQSSKIKNTAYLPQVLAGLLHSLTCPSAKLHRAAMSALVKLLDTAPPYCLSLWLARNTLQVDKAKLLFVLLNEIPGTLKQNPQRAARCMPRFAELIQAAAPKCTSGIRLSDLCLESSPVPLPQNGGEGELIQQVKVSDQICEILRVLLLLLKETGPKTQEVIMENVYTLLHSFKSIVGPSFVVAGILFLSHIPWGEPTVNTKKLFMLAKLSDSHSLDHDTIIFFSNVCINAISPVWLQRKNRNWLDVRAAISVIYQLLQRVDQAALHELYRSFLPLVFGLSLELSKLNGGDHCLDIFGFEPRENYLSTSIEAMLISHQLLQLNCQTILALDPEQIKQIILKTLRVCAAWMSDKPAIPQEWYTIHLLRISTVYLSLEYVADLLLKYFLPLPHTSATFESAIWYSFFAMLSRFVLHAHLTIPEDRMEQVSYSKIAGDLLPKSTRLLRRMWDSLSWPDSNHGYYVNLYCCPKNVTQHFVQLAFSGEPSARIVAESILVQMVECEWELNRNLDSLQVEMMVALNLMFFERQPQINSGLLARLDQCNRSFTAKISHFLSLLSDCFRYDSLFTLGRILSFLKANKVWSLMYKYVGLILKSERNFRVIGLVLLELANIYTWQDSSMVGCSSDLPFIAEPANERKDKLLHMALQCFVNGKHWMLAIKVGKELAQHYEATLNLKKLSTALRDLSEFYSKVASEPVILPNFYLVEFPDTFGSYIFEQAPDVRIEQFKSSLAQFGEVQVHTVAPIDVQLNSNTTIPWVQSCLQSTELLEFQHSQALEHSSVANMWVERTFYKIAEPLPTICGAAQVESTRVERLSPAENAMLAIKARTEELKSICDRHTTSPECKTDIYLELVLGSVISSPVNGGIFVYKELFAQHPELHEAFKDLRAATLQALVLYGQVAKAEMRPQYELFVGLYETNFM